jgi:hypothetical protein
MPVPSGAAEKGAHEVGLSQPAIASDRLVIVRLGRCPFVLRFRAVSGHLHEPGVLIMCHAPQKQGEGKFRSDLDRATEGLDLGRPYMIDAFQKMQVFNPLAFPEGPQALPDKGLDLRPVAPRVKIHSDGQKHLTLIQIATLFGQLQFASRLVRQALDLGRFCRLIVVGESNRLDHHPLQ